MPATRIIISLTVDVEDAWIDYNGHMSVPYYAHLFDRCAEQFFEQLGLGLTSAANGRGTLFALEQHTIYLREVLAGSRLKVSLQILDWDEKRIHYFMRMENAETGIAAATSEQLAIHVDLATRKSTPLPADVLTSFTDLWNRDKTEAPEEAGHIIRIRRKRLPEE